MNEPVYNVGNHPWESKRSETLDSTTIELTSGTISSNTLDLEKKINCFQFLKTFLTDKVDCIARGCLIWAF